MTGSSIISRSLVSSPSHPLSSPTMKLTSDAEYRLLPEPQSYAEFFTEVAPPTPFKSLRLKLMLFLQNASYDLDRASARLEDIGVLVTERAIVLGRLGRHTDALKLLAQDLPDTVSAQTYCTQGGEIVPPKVARAIAKHEPALAAWASLGGKRRGTVDAETQHRLVVELLRAYMGEGGRGAGAAEAGGEKGKDRGERSIATQRTATLLSAQGVHLDVLEVLDMAPADWPLDVVTTFYKRSYRRLLHERTTWQVLKSISAGQNLEVSASAAGASALRVHRGRAVAKRRAVADGEARKEVENGVPESAVGRQSHSRRPPGHTATSPFRRETR